MSEQKAALYTEKMHRKLRRQARREKWKVIRYRTDDGVRNGWLIHDTGKVMQVRLVGDCRNKRVPQKERGHVEIR